MRLHAASRYLVLALLPSFNAEMHWRKSWFYLPNMVLVLPSFSVVRPGGAAPASWWLFPLVEEAMEVPTLMRALRL